VARAGVYPGSFNPLTRAHLAIAEAAVRQCRLDRLDLVVSHRTLAKEHVEQPPVALRLDALRRAASTRPWLTVAATDAQLLADIASGYDILVLGADKWEQIQDPGFYGGSELARDAALRRLPVVAVAPRPPYPTPEGCVVLDLPSGLGAISSTEVRAGRRDWMAPEACEVDDETGAWS
jgi:hypothetical protein